MAVSVDSRTFKEASSFARAGYDSIVVQGEPGAPPASEPLFTLLTIPPATVAAGEASPDAEAVEPGQHSHVVNTGDAVEAAAELHPHALVDTPHVPHVPDPNTRLGRLAIRAQFIPARIRNPLGNLTVRLVEFAYRAFHVAITVCFRVFIVPLNIKAYLDGSRRAYPVIPPADLYYLHTHIHFPAVLARCVRHRARFVYDAHDFYSVLNRDGRPRPLGHRAIWRFHAGVERVCVLLASRCVTVSDGVAVMQRDRFKRDFAVVRNAHDRRLDENSVPSMRQQLGLEDAFLLVVVGNAKPGGMAIDSAMQALHRLPDDVHLLFLGGEYEPHQEAARRMGLGSRVHTPGRVAPVHVAASIRDADLAPILYWDATPNLRHCLPNGLFHVIAAGLPVLYPDLPEIRSVVAPLGSGMLTDTRDPGALAKAIECFRTEPGVGEAMRASAEEASHQILWEHEEPRLIEVVAPLADRHR